MVIGLASLYVGSTSSPTSLVNEVLRVGGGRQEILLAVVVDMAVRSSPFHDYRFYLGAIFLRWRTVGPKLYRFFFVTRAQLFARLIRQRRRCVSGVKDSNSARTHVKGARCHVIVVVMSKNLYPVEHLSYVKEGLCRSRKRNGAQVIVPT